MDSAVVTQLSTRASVTYDNWSFQVWVPPGHWEDAFSGEIVQGPQVLTRSSVPLTETIVYHRRPSVAVTAQKKFPGQNAATTDFSTLVVEAFASPGVVSGSVAVTRREVLLPEEAPGGLQTNYIAVDMIEHSAESATSLARCANASQARATQQRLMTVTIRDSGPRNQVKLEESPAAPPAAVVGDARRWLLRVHLSPGQKPEDVRLLNTNAQMADRALANATHMMALAPLTVGAPQPAPMGGEGMPPSWKAGFVLETWMTPSVGETRDQTGGSSWHQIDLCIGDR